MRGAGGFLSIIGTISLVPYTTARLNPRGHSSRCNSTTLCSGEQLASDTIGGKSLCGLLFRDVGRIDPIQQPCQNSRPSFRGGQVTLHIVRTRAICDRDIDDTFAEHLA